MGADDRARTLAPDRPRLAAALACVCAGRRDRADWDVVARGRVRVRHGGVAVSLAGGPWRAVCAVAIADPAAAWEALAAADVVPLGAVACADRGFAAPCAHCLGAGRRAFRASDPMGGGCHVCDAGDGVATLPHPAAVADAVALASAWPSILAAEALAREICSRLGRGAAAAAAVWSVLPRSDLLARAAVAAVAWARCPPDACGPVDDLLGYQWAWVHDAVQPRRPPACAEIDARDLVAAGVVAAAAAVPDLLATGCVLTAIGDGAMDLALPGGAW